MEIVNHFKTMCLSVLHNHYWRFTFSLINKIVSDKPPNMEVFSFHRLKYLEVYHPQS